MTQIASQPPAHIVIVGRSVAAFMSAACLSRALKGLNCRISVLEWGTAEARSGPAVLGLAPLRGFHALLGLNDAQVASFAGAKPCLGTQIGGFGLKGAASDFVLAFGETGYAFSGIGFRHILRSLQEGDATPYETFNLAAMAARAGRFTWPRPEGASVMASFTYGLNIDLDAYCAGLRAFAAANGVSLLKAVGRPEVETNATGQVTAVACGGQRLEGDLFIDATGPQALLLRQTLGVSFERVKGLKNHRLLAARAGRPVSGPLNRVDAAPFGFFNQIGLASSEACNLIYEAALIDDDEARKAFEAHFSLSPDIAVSFEQGRLSEAWAGNCVAVGSAAGVLETLCTSGLHAIQVSLTRLLSHFPSAVDQPHLRAEYNRLIAQSYDAQRDFALTPYAVHDTTGDWPQSLKRRLEQFRSRGRVVLFDEETFSEEDWSQMFLGLGLTPDRYDPRVDSLDPANVIAGVAGIRRQVAAAVQAMPYLADMMAGGRP